MARIVEVHVVEDDLASLDADRRRRRTILDPDGLVVDRHQLLHVVHGPAQVVDVHAHIAQVAVDDEVGRQYIGKVAGRGAVLPPEPDRRADDGRADNEERHELRRAAVRAALPDPPGAVLPLVQHALQPRILSDLRAERLHDRVAAQGIGQGAAHPRVPGIRQPRRRRHVEGGQERRHGDVSHRADGDHQPHDGPVQPEDDHGADQHHERRQEREQERVVQEIERPHAAGDLAHDGAGEAVGVPVGRESLHPREGILRNPRHDPQRHLDDAVESQMAQEDHHEAEPRHDDEGAQRAGQRGVPVARPERDGVDEAAREDRHEHVRERRGHHGDDDEENVFRFAAPMPEGETQNVAGRVPASLLLTHGMIGPHGADLS